MDTPKYSEEGGKPPLVLTESSDAGFWNRQVISGQQYGILATGGESLLPIPPPIPILQLVLDVILRARGKSCREHVASSVMTLFKQLATRFLRTVFEVRSMYAENGVCPAGKQHIRNGRYSRRAQAASLKSQYPWLKPQMSIEGPPFRQNDDSDGGGSADGEYHAIQKHPTHSILQMYITLER